MQILFEGVTADYQIGPIKSPLVLQSVDLAIEHGRFTAVVGHTGAGKSSLLKAMNGLIIPSEGKVSIGNQSIQQDHNKRTLTNIRKRVGMVFQFPESQLFAETVEQDICFGPVNFGVSLDEAKQITREVIQQVGLDESILTKSPFSLSGGQKRRVAIAGVLAMRPDVLVLDEPGAGLDPKGKKEILSFLTSWHQQQALTTVLVTHDMEDVAHYADDIIVIDHGKIVIHDDKRRVFSNDELLKSYDIDVPHARVLQIKVEQEIGIQLPQICLTVDELADALIEVGLV